MRVPPDRDLAPALPDRPAPVGEVDPGARRELDPVQDEVREPGEPEVPVETLKRDLFRRPLVAEELKRYNAVVFDPPRQGADAQARELAQSKVPVVIAVSCNVATFARDARILIDGGYRPGAITPVDQFRFTPHLEIVAAFSR